MNAVQHALGKLAEEAAEVAKIALKAQQFGLNEIKPGSDQTNAERINEELNDVIASIEKLNDLGLGFVPDMKKISAKQEKVLQYLSYSVELGMVDPDAIAEYGGKE